MIVLFIAALCLVAWHCVIVSGTWRYKTTIEIETPEGIKSAYAVRQVSNSASNFGPRLFPEGTNPAKVKGYGMVVDLGERGKVFVTKSGYVRGEGYKSQILYEVYGGGTSVSGIKHLNEQPIGQKRLLVPTQYPVIIMFKDPSDARTLTPVLEIEPKQGNRMVAEKFIDRFEELFGKGVRLKSISIELTDEPVTPAISEFLPSNINGQEVVKWRISKPYGSPYHLVAREF